MDVIETKLAKLTQLLRAAGAANPEDWARSEINEDIPQLARFMFLRQAWRSVIATGDQSWIHREIRHSENSQGEPGTGLGIALQNMLSQGCSPEDITEVARTVQCQLLQSVCYLLSDPSIEEPALQQVGWALVEVDNRGNIGRTIGGLHESVLETDPTGREMRPAIVARP